MSDSKMVAPAAMKLVLLSPPAEPPVQLDPLQLVENRMLLCGNSGSGKSVAMRLLFESLAPQLPVWMIDVEGEWSSLRTHFNVAFIGPKTERVDAIADPRVAGDLARKLLELNCSAVLDLSELSLADQQRFFRLLIEATLAAPPSLWGQRLIMIDEAQQFAPESGEAAESRAALIDLMRRGRKRGCGAIVATQRLSGLAKGVIAETNNIMLGRFAQDVDLQRASSVLGFVGKSQWRSIRNLQPGMFMCLGAAFGSTEVIQFRTNPNTLTRAPKPGTRIELPKPSGKLQEIVGAFAGLVVESIEPEAQGAPGGARVERSEHLRQLDAALLELSKAQTELGAAQSRTKELREQVRAAVDLLARAISWGREHGPWSPEAEPVSIDRVGPQPGTKPSPEVKPTARRTRRSKTSTRPRAEPKTDMRGSARRILSALSLFPNGLTLARLACVTGLSVRGGNFSASMRELRDRTWIDGGGDMPLKITAAGSAALGEDIDTIPAAGPGRCAFWSGKLKTGPARTIMGVFVEHYLRDSTGTLTRAEIGERTGFATKGGAFNAAMRQLRDFDIIRGKADMRLNPDLMELRG